MQKQETPKQEPQLAMLAPAMSFEEHQRRQRKAERERQRRAEAKRQRVTPPAAKEFGLW